MGKFRRHLAALMQKNMLLKRRSPCCLACEMLVAIAATGLLVITRQLVGSTSAINRIPTKLLTERAMPVRLPECATYVMECHVKLDKRKKHNPMCIAGVTYGCIEDRASKAPGVWVNSGCDGTFIFGHGVAPLYCGSGKMGKMSVCHSYSLKPEDNARGRSVRYLKGMDAHSMKPGTGSMDRAALIGGLMSMSGKTGMHRFKAKFGIAGSGAVQFVEYLKNTGHAWASNAHVFDSAEALDAHVSAPTYPHHDYSTNQTSSLCGALIFETDPYAQKVRYTLRFNTTLSPDPSLPPLTGMLGATRIKTDELVAPPSKGMMQGNFNPAGMMWYTQSGFLAIQRTVDTFLESIAVSGHGPRQLSSFGKSRSPSLDGGSIFQSMLGDDGRPHVVVPMPIAGREQDVFAMVMPNLLGAFLLISLTYSVNRMITSVVHEREARLRDGMRMMGMHSASFYASWIFTYLLIYLFVTSGVVICLSAGKILPNSSASLLFVWLMLFSSASISYALMITTFFSKAKTAATIGSVAFYASSYLEHLARPSSSRTFLNLLQMLPPICFKLTARSIANLESQGIGVCWTNAAHPFQHISVQSGCLMLAFDTVFLFVIFLYLDQVYPHEIGLRRPWYFPLLPSFWKEIFGSSRSKVAVSDSACEDQEMQESSALVEHEVGEAAAMMARNGQIVEIKGLCKTYGEIKAVRGLDLVMYSGEIFALLGHNGAGKTTTFGMLCGLMLPTRGTCVVFGHDLAAEPAEVQKILGVCPQHDVLWAELTVQEHLTLFAGFKGVAKANVTLEVDSMIQRVGLAASASAQSGHLSGGMKRKLSLGIAFLGGSQLVVLDEPTSGLDPFSRRMVWELLRAMKQGRVTVLSTHYMDEADILGDRIAILHEGSLKCCGTPQFLKRAYDCGYNVTLVKRPGCKTDSVREALICNMPELASEVVTLSDSANELMLQFPFAAAQHFPLVLGGLEQQMAELCVESYGISVTTLEEVFLKVASGENLERPSADNSGYETAMESPSDDDKYVELEEQTHQVRTASVPQNASGETEMSALASNEAKVAKNELVGHRRFFTHMCALLTKRWRYGMRDRRGLLCQLFLPTGTLLLLLAMCSRLFFHSMPLLELDATHYNAHCENMPQNLVDFTHLASVNADEATILMEPGRPFWKGDARRQAPLDEAKHEMALEESLTSTIPGLAHMFKPAVNKALKDRGDVKTNLQKTLKKHAGDLPSDWSEQLEEMLKKAGGRRLKENTTEDFSEVEAIVESELWGIVTELWASAARMQASSGDQAVIQEDGAINVDAVGPAMANHLVRHFEETLAQHSHAYRRHERRLQGEKQVDLTFPNHPEWTIRLPKEVADQLPEIQKEVADQLPQLGHNLSKALGLQDLGLEDFKGLPNLEEVKLLKDAHLYQDLIGKYKNMPEWTVCQKMPPYMSYVWTITDTDRDGYLSKEELTQALHKLTAGKSRQVPDSLLSGVVENALFLVMDADGDGKISHKDFCSFGAALQYEFDHYKGMAKHFSQQLLDSSAPCTRYGAFYILRGPRKKSSPKWQTSSDAALFVNTSSSHSAPVFQAAFTNARFARLGVHKEVHVNTHPFPQTPSEQKNLEKIAVFFLAIYITFSLSFIPSGIAHFVVKEKETGARQLQVLSGVSTICYWLSNLMFDCFLYIVPAASIPLALHHCGFSMILQGECGHALTCVLVVLGPAIAGFTYIVSFLFKDHSKAANIILTFCLVGASVLSTVLFFLALVNFNPMNKYPSACDYPTEQYPHGNCVSPKSRTAEKIMGPLFRLVPTVCVYQALFAIALVANLKAAFPQEAMEAFMAAAGEEAPHVSFSPFAYEWAGEPLIYLTCEAIGYLFVVVVLDTCLNHPRLSKIVDPAGFMQLFNDWRAQRSAGVRDSLLTDAVLNTVGEGSGDDSVELERERVAFLSASQVALHVSSLVRTYRQWLALSAPPKNAVRGVSLAVHRGEVFGLLGHNGAGKTSALKCMIGELNCTAGAVHVGGYNMEQQVGLARQQIGYCPQFDALLELLTVQDHLEFFAALKGLPKHAVAQAQKDFSLEKNIHRRADVLSGGNKRKLSAAIALIGQPSLAVLDEPSCGLDPAARRALWSAVHCAVGCSTMQGDKATAVLLTTHSMEEAEALSTRLGIMADGQLLTIGTNQQIKQRHGSCHELCFSLMTESQEVLTSTLHHLGNGLLEPGTPLDFRSVGPLLESDAWKKRAYVRPRCVVRAQIESTGVVEAAVLAEWWLQQARGEAVETFLKNLLGTGVELAENFGPYWRFRLPFSASVGLPQMFEHLESSGRNYGISEYTLTQATLEQIFNSMTSDADAERQAAVIA